MLDIEKFEQRAAELGRRRWRNLHTILPMACAEGTQGRDEVYHAMRQEIADGVLHRDDLFPGLDRYLWARAQVTLPPAREGCQVVGLFDFGRTAEGAIEGFESLLYLDGHPYQAVDQNHPEVVLDDFAGQTVTLTFLLWTGLGGKQPGTRQWHRIRQADVGYLDCAADELYYLIRTAAQTLRLLDDTQPARTDLLRAVNGALQRIDWDQDSFYDSLPGARDFFAAGAGRRQDVHRRHGTHHRTHPHRCSLAVAAQAHPGKGPALFLHGPAADGGIPGICLFADAAPAV